MNGRIAMFKQAGKDNAHTNNGKNDHSQTDGAAHLRPLAFSLKATLSVAALRSGQNEDFLASKREREERAFYECSSWAVCGAME
jgi:hypothetical protein